MTLLKIAHLGHPILRQRAKEVSPEALQSDSVQIFIDDLVETMRDANGAGLAAIQVYRPIRIIAVEVKNNPRYPYKPNIPLSIWVNPVITFLSAERFSNYEGCLSVPNFRGRVLRCPHILLEANDRNGKPIKLEAKGLKAATIQHEVDHLDGLLFVDRVTDSKSLTTWTEFERFHREAFIQEAEAIVQKYGE